VFGKERASASAALTFHQGAIAISGLHRSDIAAGWGQSRPNLAVGERLCHCSAKERKLPDKKGLAYCWQARRFLNHRQAEE
jgi:hypothetical protein